jgi:hypothetical protein
MDSRRRLTAEYGRRTPQIRQDGDLDLGNATNRA